MATIDDERGVVVVRVVYDGPALSGKTTTLRRLADGLGVPVVSPEERDGRTLYFDWMEYVGGLYEGRRIHCQVLSVPAQRELAERRQMVLDMADAVVVVMDTRASEVEEALALLASTAQWCRAETPPVGIVVQANKRDDPDAVSRAWLADRVADIAPTGIVETVAVAGDGVRESFVFGVRLALDRVRALAEAGRLEHGRPDTDNAEDLLEQMVGLAPPPAPPSVLDDLERSAADSPPEADSAPEADSPPEADSAPEAAEERPEGQDEPVPVAPEPASTPPREERPFVPDPALPGGFIWPPVDGRSMLHEVAQRGLTVTRTSTGDWEASDGSWRLHSWRDALYDDQQHARAGLIDWARLHAAHLERLSPGRVVLLADAGEGRFRLWQIVRVHRTLADALSTAETDAPKAVVAALTLAAQRLLEVRRTLDVSDLALRTSLENVADRAGRASLVGLMAGPGTTPPRLIDDAELITREFEPVIRQLRDRHPEFAAIRRDIAEAGQRQLDTVTLTLAGLIETLGTELN